MDHVKLVDVWPAEEMLATIFSEQTSNGGGAYNLLVDLARLGAGFPLSAAGLVGCDAAGDWIIADCTRQGIETSALHRREGAATSYTDAFTAIGTGKRTFFHHRGANASLTGTDVDLSQGGAKLFYLGYLMLLDELDKPLPDGSTGASRLLEQASAAGYTTVADMVSVAHRDLIPGTLRALPHLDHFILNELEAGQLSGQTLRLETGGLDASAMEAAAAFLLKAGVRKSVTIHAVEGAVTASASGCVRQGSVRLPSGYIKGATGAGDAFAAGWVYGLHEEWTPEQGLRLGVCAAAACLADPTPSQGILPISDCLALGEALGFRDFPG